MPIFAEPYNQAHGRIEDVLGIESALSADDGVRLWSVRSGSSGDFSFVLCHGGPGIWDELAPVAAMVADLGEVIRWDQRGGGRSDRCGPYSIERFVADLECLRRAHGVERWIVGGHSWGAGLALRSRWSIRAGCSGWFACLAPIWVGRGTGTAIKRAIRAPRSAP